MKRITRLAGLLLGVLALLAILTSTASAANPAPTATTGASIAASPTTALITGTANIEGGTLDGTEAGIGTGGKSTTGCYFEYGTSTSYGSYVSCTPTPSGTTTTTVAGGLTALTGGATYHYKLILLVEQPNALGVSLPTQDYTVTTSDATFTLPSASVPPKVSGLSATAATATTATLDATANAENWPITSCTIVYGTSAASLTSTMKCPTTPTGATDTAETASLSGLAANTQYFYNVVLGYDTDGTSQTATTASGTAQSFLTPTSGASTNGAATSISTTGATLNATVNPQGQPVTTCEFVYYKSGSPASMAPCDQSTASLSGGTADVPVTATVTGLTPGALYGYDILLITPTGQSIGALGTFTTLTAPTGVTHAATAVTSSTATLNGTVNAEGSGVVGCAFQYGVSPLPANSISGTNSGLAVSCTRTPSSTGNQNVSIALRGLASHTKYYYRVILSTAAGNVVIGSTVTFTTASAAKKVTAPGMKITSAKVDTKRLQASFHFAHTGDAATSSQCGLALVTKGKVAKFTYKTCKSGILEKKLKKKAAYVFYVRGHNSAGYGKAASKKFTA